MWKVNSKGRSYSHRKALSIDTRTNIIDEIKDGDKTTCMFPGKFIDIANVFKVSSSKVSSSTVSKIWRQYCASNDLDPKHRGEGAKVYITVIFS
jgi:hypothetical protein